MTRLLRVENHTAHFADGAILVVPGYVDVTHVAAGSRPDVSAELGECYLFTLRGYWSPDCRRGFACPVVGDIRKHLRSALQSLAMFLLKRARAEGLRVAAEKPPEPDLVVDGYPASTASAH
jgi:hypothetical protein